MSCKLIILLVCLVGAAMGDRAPTFVFGSDSPPRPTLHTMSQDEFAELLEPFSKTTMFLCFLQDKLEMSDFACSKSNTEDSCYANLKGVSPKAFYTVHNPTEAMRQLSPDREYASIDANGNLDRKVVWQAGKVLFIILEPIFDKFGQPIPRDELLESHDQMISKVYKDLSEQGKVTAVYTSTQSSTNVSKSRRRRATATQGTTFRSGKDFLLFYTDLAIQTPSTEPNKPPVVTPITISSMTISEKNATNFKVNMEGPGNKLSFRIKLVGWYYQMKEMVLNGEDFFVSSELNAPTDFSYYCGNQTFASAKTDSPNIIIWNSLQMQAPFDEKAADDFKFGEPWYCVGFFSSGILAGLFVVFILLGIVSVGICWMLDINTMDRFDDPKGKTITINVNE